MNQSFNEFLQGLNASQLDAINSLDGPLLILAGAGTGKTRVLTTRIANLIHTSTARNDNILALTFTNKAANEMKERIENIVGNLSGMWVGTFHSIGIRLLRTYNSAINLENGFVVIGESDRNKLFKNILIELNIEEKRYPVKLISFLISSLKEKCITENDEDKISAIKYKEIDISSVYKKYQERLKIYNMLDFDDLIMLTIKLFKHNPNILSDIQDRFRYILVDEYQDTSHNQHLLLRLLASKYYNICCVGDEDQSIYSWRGANVGNILSFGNDFAGAKIIRLEENYRSTGNILNVAISVISNNKSRYGKTLFSNIGDGHTVNIFHVQDGRQEAQQICDYAKYYHDYGESYNNMAILVRAAFQIRSLEEMLMHNNLPYRVVDGLKFYDKKEIKDVISYIRFIFSDWDVLAFERIINLPKRGIGEKTVSTIIDKIHTDHMGISIVMEKMLNNGEFPTRLQKEIQLFLENLKYWRSCVNIDECKLSELTDIVVNQSGYSIMLKNEEDDGVIRLDNIKELINSLDGFDTIEEFLEHVSLFGSKNDESEGSSDAINILTMHGSKGLEYEVVFLPGWEEGIFPSTRSVEENGDAGLEEERRLAYVAITRAKKYLNIFHTDSRFIFGRYQASLRSRFIDEMIQKLKNSSVLKLINTQNIYNVQTNKIIKTEQKFVSYIAPKKEEQRYESFSKADADKDMMEYHPKIGDIVTHTKFGKGKVVGIIGAYADVSFEDTKRLIQRTFLTQIHK